MGWDGGKGERAGERCMKLARARDGRGEGERVYLSPVNDDDLDNIKGIQHRSTGRA